jgi:hypothetical protein
MQLKVLDLFSGLGGFSLGLERTGYFKTIAFCEIDKYCSLILDKHWKGIKIYNDVRKINKEQFDTDGIEYPDIITGGFPCQPFRLQANKKEQETIDISGLKCFESSKLSNQNSLLAKMSKALLTSKTAWSSRLCVLTWKVKDTKFKRSIFQLQVSVPRTGEKESGSSQLWATPNSMDHLPQRSPEALLRQATTTRKGRTRPANLREQVNPETVKMWRTPDAHCNRGPSSKERMKMKLEKGMPISLTIK